MISAQIAGATVRSAVFDPSSTMKTSKKVVKALKGRDAVLLKDNGALCCGPSKSDAQATEMVMVKAAKPCWAPLYSILQSLSMRLKLA